MGNDIRYECLGDLTEANACRKGRAFDVDLTERPEGETYYRAAIIKATIKNALKYNIRDPKAVMQYMRTRYPECGFKNYQQRQATLLWDHRRVMRYLDAEGRKPFFPPKDTVIIRGNEIEVRPDVVFESGEAAELVLFKIGKPTMTQTGRGNQYQKEMQLYALQLYGRKKGYKVITASFYFLKKNTDTSYWNQCDQSFFGGGGNVIQIKDIYDPDVYNELDGKMGALLKQYEDGIEEEKQAAETCVYCKHRDVCKYTLPPVELDRENEKEDSAATAAVSFSDQQQQAIDFRKGVCRIVAGAGSGKTKTIVERVVRLLNEGTKPEEICMITFTKNGAEEMKRRIENEIGHELPALTVSTFNAFENDIVMREWADLGYAKKPVLIDDVQSFSIIARLLNENPILEWTGRCFLHFSVSGGYGTRGALQVAADVFAAVKRAKKDGSDPLMAARVVTCSDDINGTALSKLAALYDKYEALLKARGLIDYEDQEILTFEVIKKHQDYLDKNYRFRHIVVDEFQDSSEGQISLIKYMAAMKTFESLMVVGDDAQSVYGFRNTTPEYIIRFEDHIGMPVKDIILDYNFRSTPQICAFGTAIIDNNVDKVDKILVPVQPDGAPVVVNGFNKAIDEYRYIVKGIQHQLQNGEKPEDIAILAYTKGELRRIADELTRAGIPSMFGAPEPLMDNSRVRAILAFARLLRTDMSADAAICANALIGGGLMELEKGDAEAKITKMKERARAVRDAAEGTKKEKFMKFVEDTAFGDEAVESFTEAFENLDFDDTLDYLRDFEMYGGAVEYRRTRRYPGVMLTTAHSSKGLEWKIVYNTISKYPKSFSGNSGGMEETRRLFFVSTTRARDQLFVTGLFRTGTKEHSQVNRLLMEAFDICGKAFPCVV